jgi:hypothetical protein
MTRTFKISAENTPRQERQHRKRGNRMHRKTSAFDEERYGAKLDKPHVTYNGRRWTATPETYNPAKPQAKWRTPMDIKGSKTPRAHTKNRFFVNVDHHSTRDKVADHLEGLEDITLLEHLEYLERLERLDRDKAQAREQARADQEWAELTQQLFLLRKQEEEEEAKVKEQVAAALNARLARWEAEGLAFNTQVVLNTQAMLGARITAALEETADMLLSAPTSWMDDRESELQDHEDDEDQDEDELLRGGIC